MLHPFRDAPAQRAHTDSARPAASQLTQHRMREANDPPEELSSIVIAPQAAAERMALAPVTETSTRSSTGLQHCEHIEHRLHLARLSPDTRLQHVHHGCRQCGVTVPEPHVTAPCEAAAAHRVPQKLPEIQRISFTPRPDPVRGRPFDTTAKRISTSAIVAGFG